jgi:peptidoglycan/xylan/chitin deacetylase (PgdA/CDA1 family)
VHADDDPDMPKVSPNQHGGHVTASVFRRQMAAIAERGFKTIQHKDIKEWLYGESDLPEGKLIAINFDDNRLNVYENAVPVMEEYEFQGTVWVVSRLADGNLSHMQTYPWMTWDHLGKLAEMGWEIGAHTASHDFLPRLLRGTDGPDGSDRVVETLAECNEALKQRIGVKTEHFAYPGGEWEPDSEAFVVRYYATARHWVCDDRPYELNTYETNPYRLQAINVSMHMTEEKFLAILDEAN